MYESIRKHTAFALLLTSIAGCSRFGEFKLPGIETAGERNAAFEEEQQHRHAYQSEGSTKAMRWLKANRIHSGMRLRTVNETFGEDGQRVWEDAKYKSRGGHYRAGDETYKWGPDRDGNAHVLVFRDDRLVDFDPKEYR